MQQDQIIEVIGRHAISNVYNFKIYMTHASDDSFSWSRTKREETSQGTLYKSDRNYPLYDRLTFDGDFMCIQKDNCDTYININYISAIVVKKYSQEEK